MSNGLPDRLARLCAGVAARGLVGPLASGNVSLRDQGWLAITRSGVALAAVTPADAVLCRLDAGLAVEGSAGGTPSTETPLHLAAYRARPDASVVLHLHAPWTVAASCLELDRLPLVHYHQGLLDAVPTPVVPYATPGSEELARAVGAALADEGVAAVLLASHGAVVVSAAEEEALALAEALEDVCRLVVLTAGRARALDPAELPRLRALFGGYGRRP